MLAFRALVPESAGRRASVRKLGPGPYAASCCVVAGQSCRTVGAAGWAFESGTAFSGDDDQAAAGLHP